MSWHSEKKENTLREVFGSIPVPEG
ncbi:MAG: hypothetical protein RJA76_1989, partial [Bacteroidota bacterium]